MIPEEELKKYQEMEKRLKLRVIRLRVAHEISKQTYEIYVKEKDSAHKDIEAINTSEIAYELGNAAGELKAIQIKIKEKKEKLELKKSG